MSLLGGIAGGLINPINLAQLAMGPAGWASLATRMIGQAIGQQVIQQLGQMAGLPQSMIDMAQASFCASSGNMQGARANIREAVEQLGKDFGLSPSEQGNLQRAAEQDAKDMFEKLADAFKSGKEKAEAHKSKGGKGRSWLQAIADSMAKVLDAKVQDMDKQAQALDKQGSNKSVKSSTDLQVSGQEFSYLMNASSTVIKTIGEGLSGMARKS